MCQSLALSLFHLPPTSQLVQFSHHLSPRLSHSSLTLHLLHIFVVPRRSFLSVTLHFSLFHCLLHYPSLILRPLHHFHAHWNPLIPPPPTYIFLHYPSLSLLP